MDFGEGLPIPRRVGAQFPVDRRSTGVGTRHSTRMGTVFRNRSSGFVLVVKPYSTSGGRDMLSCVNELGRITSRIGSGVLVVPQVCAGGPHAANSNCGNVLRRPSPSGAPSVLRNVLTVHSLRVSTLHSCNFAYTSRVLCPSGCHCLSSLLKCITINTHSIRGRRRHLATDKVSIPMNVGGPADNSLSIVVGSVATTRRPRAFVCHN